MVWKNPQRNRGTCFICCKKVTRKNVIEHFVEDHNTILTPNTDPTPLCDPECIEEFWCSSQNDELRKRNIFADILEEIPYSKKRKRATETNNIIKKTKLDKLMIFRMVPTRCYKGEFYWIYGAIPLNSTLKDLDTFIRNIWTNRKCGLSSFSIIGERNPFSKSNFLQTKNTISAFREGTSLLYMIEGPTTELKIEFLGCSSKFSVQGIKDVKILARNDCPIWLCDSCGKEATFTHQFKNDYCDECLENKHLNFAVHKITNSPRHGINFR